MKRFTRRIELYTDREEGDHLDLMTAAMKTTTSTLIRALLAIAYERWRRGSHQCALGEICPYDRPVNLFQTTFGDQNKDDDKPKT